MIVGSIACHKNGDGPISIKLTSISSDVVPVQGQLNLNFSFTDGSAVIDTFGLIKIRTNQLQTQTLRDTLYYNVPVYPQSTKGEFQIAVGYADLTSAISPPTTGNPPVNVSDSLILRFFAKDQSKHTSDTLTSGLVIIMR